MPVGAWTGKSGPGDWAESGCHCGNPESASEVSSLKQVSVPKEDPPPLPPPGSFLEESRAAGFQGLSRGWGKGSLAHGPVAFPFTLCVRPDPTHNSTCYLRVQGL